MTSKITIRADREFDYGLFLGWNLTVRRNGIIIEVVFVSKESGSEALSTERRRLKAHYKLS